MPVPLPLLLLLATGPVAGPAAPDATATPPREAPSKTPRARPAPRRAGPPRTVTARRQGPEPRVPGKGKRRGLRAVHLVRGPNGHRWLRIGVAQRLRFSLLPGLGYAHGFRGRRLNHFLVQAGLGLAVYGRWTTWQSRTRMMRIRGHGLYAHLCAELGIPLARDAAPTHLSFPLRLQQTFAMGRHALMLIGSLGPRWDLVPGRVGLQATLGLGYTLILPPAGIPIVLEALHQSQGAYDTPVWGLRLSVAWPITW